MTEICQDKAPRSTSGEGEQRLRVCLRGSEDSLTDAGPGPRGAAGQGVWARWQNSRQQRRHRESEHLKHVRMTAPSRCKINYTVVSKHEPTTIHLISPPTPHPGRPLRLISNPCRSLGPVLVWAACVAIRPHTFTPSRTTRRGMGQIVIAMRFRLSRGGKKSTDVSGRR
jgi:hypothetical protein